MTDIPKYYWDACIWIELINTQNPDWVARCIHVVDLATNNKAELWTSAFTLAEVFKKKCHGANVGITKNQDEKFDDFIDSDLIKIVNVDAQISRLARYLLREYPKIRKPQDAIHLATCLTSNLDELHTFDMGDLAVYDGKIARKDGKMLKICSPPPPPPN